MVISMQPHQNQLDLPSSKLHNSTGSGQGAGLLAVRQSAHGDDLDPGVVPRPLAPQPDEGVGQRHVARDVELHHQVTAEHHVNFGRNQAVHAVCNDKDHIVFVMVSSPETSALT